MLMIISVSCGLVCCELTIRQIQEMEIKSLLVGPQSYIKSVFGLHIHNSLNRKATEPSFLVFFASS